LSTKDSTTTSRPAKPYPGFPLYAHKSGRWAKKSRGKTHFFGPWRDPVPPENSVRLTLHHTAESPADQQRGITAGLGIGPRG